MGPKIPDFAEEAVFPGGIAAIHHVYMWEKFSTRSCFSTAWLALQPVFTWYQEPHSGGELHADVIIPI